MVNGPLAAAKQLEKHVAVEDKPRKLIDILRTMIEVERGLDTLEAADLADVWYSRFESRVQLQLTAAEDDGSFLTYTFNSASREYVQGACFIEGTDTDKARIEKRARAKQESYLSYYKNLSPTRFECLCGKVIELLRVEAPHVTKSSSDQGVDFFGRLPFGTLLNPRDIPAGAERQLSVWLVGQAKHYEKTAVSTRDIRELVGSVILAQSKTFAGKKDPLERLELRVCDPVVYFFITTGRFTRDSKELLNRSGVVAMDGVQLSVFLADNLAGHDGDELSIETIERWLEV